MEGAYFFHLSVTAQGMAGVAVRAVLQLEVLKQQHACEYMSWIDASKSTPDGACVDPDR